MATTTNPPLGFYYRQYGVDKWEEITDYVDHQSLSWNDSLEPELLQFSFNINDEPRDSLGELIIPFAGDEVVVCEDQTRNTVLGDVLGGKILISKKQQTGAWECDEDRPILRYEITVRQHNFSLPNLVKIVEDTPTDLGELLERILSPTMLGGNLPNTGIFYPAYDATFSSTSYPVNQFEYEGTSLEAFLRLLDSTGHNFSYRYFCEPDDTNLLNVVFYVIVFNNSGLTPSAADSDFLNGIRNPEIKNGVVIRQPDLTERLWGESEFDASEDVESVLNAYRIFALLQQEGNPLTRFTQKQNDIPKDEIDLGYPYTDILWVARHIDTVVTDEALPTSTSVTIPEDAAQKIRDYDQPRADFLVCRVVSKISDQEYFRAFTISGRTITFYAIENDLLLGTAEINPVPAVGDRWELVKGVTVLPDNREYAEGYPVYGCVYDATLDNRQTATVKFMKYNLPKSTDTVIIYGHRLEKHNRTEILPESVARYGLRLFEKELDFPITKKQLQQIMDVLEVRAEPKVTVTFTTQRPYILKPGAYIPIQVTNMANNNFYVNSVDNTYINSQGQRGTHLIAQRVECTNYRDELEDLLNRLRTAYKLKKATQEENLITKQKEEISLACTCTECKIVTGVQPTVVGFNASDWTFVLNSFIAGGLLEHGFANTCVSFLTNRVNVFEGFEVNFAYNALNIDGFAFVLQNEALTAYGDPSGALAVYDSTDVATNGIQKSVAIEFDQFKNTWDPYVSHIGFNYNGNPNSGANVTSLGQVATSGSHVVKITYDGTVLRVYFDTVLALSQVVNLKSITGASDNYAWAGFTSGGRMTFSNLLLKETAQALDCGSGAVFPDPASIYNILPASGLPGIKEFNANVNYDGSSFTLIDFSGYNNTANQHFSLSYEQPFWVSDPVFGSGIDLLGVRNMKYNNAANNSFPLVAGTHIIIVKCIAPQGGSEVIVRQVLNNSLVLNQNTRFVTSTHESISPIIQTNYLSNELNTYMTVGNYYAFGWGFDRSTNSVHFSQYDFQTDSIIEATWMIIGQPIGDLPNFNMYDNCLFLNSNVGAYRALRSGFLWDGNALTGAEMNNYLHFLGEFYS